MKVLKLTLALLVLTISTVFASNDHPQKDGYKIGDVVEYFSLKNVDNKNVGLKDYNNAKGVVVIFTCNHCPYSKMYENRIIALDKKYKSKTKCISKVWSD